MCLSFLSVEFSLLNNGTVVWVTERGLSLEVTLVLYYIFLVGAVFHLFLKQLKNLSSSCKAVTAFRETGFSLTSSRLLEPECITWESYTVCCDTGAKQCLERATVLLELRVFSISQRLVVRPE